MENLKNLVMDIGVTVLRRGIKDLTIHTVDINPTSDKCNTALLWLELTISLEIRVSMLILWTSLGVTCEGFGASA